MQGVLDQVPLGGASMLMTWKGFGEKKNSDLRSIPRPSNPRLSWLAECMPHDQEVIGLNTAGDFNLLSNVALNGTWLRKIVFLDEELGKPKLISKEKV